MVPHERTWLYNNRDCIAQALSYAALRGEINESPTERVVYDTIVRPLIPAVARMRRRGMLLDLTRRASMRSEAESKRDAYEAHLQAIYGPDLKLSNKNSVAKLLFTDLGFPVLYRTATGKPKMDVATLTQFLLENDNPIFDTILRHNELHKFISTFIDGTRPDEDMRVRAYWLIHGTATGRLSCRDPDLQNIPEREPINARLIFVARPGYVLLNADAEQLELRLLGYASGCRHLLECIERGLDLHSETASAVYGVPVRAVSALRRKIAKGYRFAEVYGAGDAKIRTYMMIKSRIALELHEIARIRTRMTEVEHEVYKWREMQYEVARAKRVLANAYGRARRIFVPDADIRGVAFNTIIQSTAADYINKVFLRLDALGAPIICQVHDSIVLEVPRADWPRWVDTLKEEFERPQELWGRTVVLPCKVEMGESWGALEKAA